MGRLRNWYEGTVDEEMIRRCKALALQIWPTYVELAVHELEDTEDEYDLVEVSFWPQYPRRVSLQVGNEAVLLFVPVDALEDMLKALAAKVHLDHEEERDD